MTSVQVRMLGGFSITCGTLKREYHMKARKNWLLIAYLLLNRDRMVSRKELVGLFQDSAYSTDANRMLRNRLMRIRKCLAPLSEEVGEDLILIQYNGCRWNPNIMVSFDTDQFQRLCSKARAGNSDTQLRLDIQQAYGAGFLPMFHEPWLDALQSRYAGLYKIA